MYSVLVATPLCLMWLLTCRFFDGMIKKVESTKINGIQVDIAYWKCTIEGDNSKARYNFGSQGIAI